MTAIHSSCKLDSCLWLSFNHSDNIIVILMMMNRQTKSKQRKKQISHAGFPRAVASSFYKISILRIKSILQHIPAAYKGNRMIKNRSHFFIFNPSKSLIARLLRPKSYLLVKKGKNIFSIKMSVALKT